MEGNKYILSMDHEDLLFHKGRILHRIIALRDIVDEKGNILVKKGEKGGYVEGKNNLSQVGTCWVYPNGKVYDYAKVGGNAKILDNGEIYDDAEVSGNAEVYVKVSGLANVGGNAKMKGKHVIMGTYIGEEEAE